MRPRKGVRNQRGGSEGGPRSTHRDEIYRSPGYHLDFLREWAISIFHKVPLLTALIRKPSRLWREKARPYEDSSETRPPCGTFRHEMRNALHDSCLERCSSAQRRAAKGDGPQGPSSFDGGPGLIV